MNRTRQALQEHVSLYATSGDFCRIFNQDMNNLYLLSLLLTADSEMAEECVVSGLEECSQTNRVFQEWAASWARRMIIQNAIRRITPAPVNTDSSPADLSGVKTMSGRRPLPELRSELSDVMGLNAFERFVFVMTILEGYSDQDSALMLGCARQEVIAARVHAMQQIGHSANIKSGNQMEAAANRNGGSRAVALDRDEPLAFAAAVRLATPA